MLGIASKYMLRATLVGVLAYGGYKLYHLGSYICGLTTQTVAKALTWGKMSLLLWDGSNRYGVDSS